MSDRDLRKSTIKATEETKSLEEARHSRKQLNKQHAVYYELFAKQEREIHELSDSHQVKVVQLVLKKLTEISNLMMKKVLQ